MKISRRELLLSLAMGSFLPKAWAQGEASRGVKPQERLPPSGRPFHARFVDVGIQAGLAAPILYGDPEHADYLFESVGCGCAFFDFDNDGWMDIFLLSGTRTNGAPPGATNRLYRNNRDGTFTDVTRRAGLEKTGWAASVCIGDYNNDGFEDLFCTYFGENVLYRNNGDGSFTDVTKIAGLAASPQWGAGCTFLDYNRDGNLDLFVSNYAHVDFAHLPKPGQSSTCNWKGTPVACGPIGLPFPLHSLYRNNGDGTFADVSGQSGIRVSHQSYGMTVVAADFDRDGWPDIYVACDSSPSLLFMNNRDGTFREEGLLRGVAVNEDGQEQAGMGIGLGDTDLAGHLNIYKTHFTEDNNVLYRNNGKGDFEDVTIASRLGVETRYTCWGTGIQDFDNDGFPDIFVVTGSVYPGLEKKLKQYPDKGPRLLFRNLGNRTFEELENVGPGFAGAHSSRGCAFGDFDNDGDVDILVVNMNEPPSLLRNDVRPGNHWLKVRLVGTKSNRSGIGTLVLARYGGKLQVQQVLSQSSFYSCNDPRLHFGLGSASLVDLEIRWPSGLTQILKKVSSGQCITVLEGSGMVPTRGWSKHV